MKYVSITGFNGAKYDNGQRSLSTVYGTIEDERATVFGREFLVKRLDSAQTAWVDADRCVEGKPWAYMTVDEKRQNLQNAISKYRLCIANGLRIGSPKKVTTPNQLKKLRQGLASLEQRLKELN